MDFYLDCVQPWYETRRVGKIIGLEESGRQKQSKNGTRRRVNLKNVKSVPSAIYGNRRSCVAVSVSLSSSYYVTGEAQGRCSKDELRRLSQGQGLGG